MRKPPTRQQLCDWGVQPLIEQYGQNLALTFVLACIQHRTGRQYDPWASNQARDITEADIQMAKHLLDLAKRVLQPEPEPPAGHWVTPE